MKKVESEGVTSRYSPEKVWGWMPAESVVIAIGLLLISVACSGSRISAPWSDSLFWVGYFFIILIPIIRLSMRGVSRQERIATLLFVGIALYFVKILYFPNYFALNDELQHWRSAEDTIRIGTLFQYNSTLPVSSYFPGLESITNSFISLSTLNIFDSGIVVIGLARILSLLALFLLFERMSKSSYAAGIASLIYFAHPGFMLGYSQFAYEPLAVALMIMGLYFALRRVQFDESRRRLSLLVVAVLCVSSVVVTHHVTSYSMALLVSIWGILSILTRNLPEWKFGPAWLTMLIVSACVAWLALVGPIVIPYISAPVQTGFTQTLQVILGEQSPRAFFQPAGGRIVPLWIQIPSYLSVIFLVLSLPFGLVVIWRDRKTKSLPLAMAIMSLGYFVSQGLRLAPLGLGLTNRLASIVFLPLSYVLGAGAVEYFRRRYLKGAWMPALVAWLLIIVVGSSTAVIAARPLPGPYDPNMFTRDINTEGVLVADWALNVLKPDHRFGADYINMLLLGSYGRQRLVTDLSDNIFLQESIYSSSQFGPSEKDILQKGGVDYLVLDTRLSDKQVLGPVIPDSPVYVTNLDGLETVDRIFDSGHVIIYRLGFVGRSVTTSSP